jgi:hypothetical protein
LYTFRVRLGSASSLDTIASVSVLLRRGWGRSTASARLFTRRSHQHEGALAGCELWMMQAETPAQFATALRRLQVPVWMIIMALIGFVLVNLRAGRFDTFGHISLAFGKLVSG